MQKTSTGLAYYLPDSNIAAFTSGFFHWALTERGLVTWVGDSVAPPASARLANQPGGDEPDVLLDVPTLRVDTLTLEVEQLEARVSLLARLGSLLRLRAGVDASVEQLQLALRGVNAEVHLRADLEDAADMIDATLTLLDRNPQLIEEALSATAGP